MSDSDVRCGMGLLILYGLQGLIDEGKMTGAEAAALILELGPGVAPSGEEKKP